ncbi:hypothetical protein BKA93DRAFT_728831 [Sparassis latifolia]|uniref:Uncharacterized protein n=1 Tax=Sparassis crispa TaxID=139825 RepID=A0A401GAS4_9APHY|nr:hypothetical protein SCP_0204400 [Sparassis crispa]GBE79243.1 hypothetical protein SCP_0204400 [Sparassis crispa]
MSHLSAYRVIVREVNRASISPRTTRNPVVASNFRAIFEQRPRGEQSADFEHDIQDVITFLTSQRMHKTLLDRYNPLHDLTPEQRIEATARRVGLNMPSPVKSDGDKE